MKKDNVATFTSKKGKQVVVRSINPEDLDALTQYANELIKEDTFVSLFGKKLTKSFEKQYLEDSLKKIEKGTKIHLVAEIDGILAGISEIRRLDRRSTHVGEIGISIHKNYRDEGIGLQFLKTLIDEGRKLGLTLLVLSCFEINSPAIHMYEKVGFTKAGVIPGLYMYKHAPVGEVRMYLPL